MIKELTIEEIAFCLGGGAVRIERTIGVGYSLIMSVVTGGLTFMICSEAFTGFTEHVGGIATILIASALGVATYHNYRETRYMDTEGETREMPLLGGISDYAVLNLFRYALLGR